MPVDLTPIRARMAKATPGPWRMQTAACDHEDEDENHTAIKGGGALVTECIPEESDAILIANAPTDIAALCDEVEYLRAQLAQMRAPVKRAADYRPGLDYAAGRDAFAAGLSLHVHLDPGVDVRAWASGWLDAARHSVNERLEVKP